MSEYIHITKLVIKFPNTELELTLPQARALYLELKDLFEPKPATVYRGAPVVETEDGKEILVTFDMLEKVLS